MLKVKDISDEELKERYNKGLEFYNNSLILIKDVMHKMKTNRLELFFLEKELKNRNIEIENE